MPSSWLEWCNGGLKVIVLLYKINKSTFSCDVFFMGTSTKNSSCKPWFERRLTHLFRVTPWKINMEPKNKGLEDDVPFQKDDFEVPCSFSGVYTLGFRKKKPSYATTGWHPGRELAPEPSSRSNFHLSYGFFRGKGRPWINKDIPAADSNIPVTLTLGVRGLVMVTNWWSSLKSLHKSLQQKGGVVFFV